MEIDAKTIKELRDKTGARVMDCKRALEEAKGDLPAAEMILKRKGIAEAGTKAERATKEGRIFSYIHTNGKIGVLLEINCETDFVAKNEEFGAMARDLCLQVAAQEPLWVSREEVPAEVVEKEKAVYAADATGKPPAIAEKILTGKLDKNLYGAKCLLEQIFIKDEEKKTLIGDLVKAKISKFGENITVRRFVRYEVGK
ncbi:MAG: translation elongation factor Ts [Planctomycetes bacterium]|nr:translation elongation factor Ts [Planctomycetota bacterium]